jgi:hypothetical protein
MLKHKNQISLKPIVIWTFIHYYRVVHWRVSAYIYIYILPYRYSETRNHLYGEPAGRAEESHRGTPPIVAGAAGASVPEDKVQQGVKHFDK